MGDIIRYKCSCGYEKRLHTGGGLALPGPELVARFFPANVVSDYSEAYTEGKVTDFSLIRVPASCPVCKELITVPFFQYHLSDGKEHSFVTACPECRKPAHIFSDEEAVSCPKCGSDMTAVSEGVWD